jgi:hypothetical protein
MVWQRGKSTLRVAIALVGACWAAVGAAAAGPTTATVATPPAPGRVDFTRDVQPILADNCYFCHGPDANHRKGDLRLDVLDPKEGPFAKRDGYAIVARGKSDDSVLFGRISATDPDDRMPPADSNRHLTAAQVETLRKWIEQGAEWGKMWSLVPPRRGDLPAINNGAWPKNAIDPFILARLEHEGLKPSPEAGKQALIRRVTLDLTGLPPTPEEVDAFVNDASPDAYEKVVDRLLASPRYGERMVWEWLEASRYADTNGYQNDPTRTGWPWRDWVIAAMNQNMPYDQFVVWQVAGDLLADRQGRTAAGGPATAPSTQPSTAAVVQDRGTPARPAWLPGTAGEMRLASSFNRNHPFNGEGGRIPEETRVENVMDRTDTVGTVFLGLTVGCAKCHDHKFDPISQKEYYALYAYFNQSSETGQFQYVNGGNVLPVMTVKSATDAIKEAALKQAAKDAADRLATALPKVEAKQAEWEKTLAGEKGWTAARPVLVRSNGGASMQLLDADGSVLVSGTNPETDVHEVLLRTDLPRVTGVRLDPLPDVSLPQGGPGRSIESGNFVLTQIDAVAVSVADPTQNKKITFATADATYSQASQEVAGAIDTDPKTGWAVFKAPDKSALSAVFGIAEPVGFPGGTEIRLRLRYESKHPKHSMGRFKLSLTEGTVLSPDVAAALAVANEKRDEIQKKVVRDFYLKRVSTEFKPLNDAVAAAKKAVDDFDKSLTRTMVMDDAKPRETHVLTKSAYDKPADKVDAGVLAVLNPLPAGAKNDRLALALWMIDPANPLTARVTVNRYWQQFFGVGLVKTVDDFGVQGERPANPELLDYLAVEFRESGWNVKAMHRLMVTSAAYRQTSKVTPDLLERDPDNRLLARGPRFRLAAPVIRDQSLAASGLLVEKVGGPPVKPYQPPGIWEEATFGQIKYEQDHGDALYRRSAYVFWRRIVGPTEMFDTGSRSACVVRPSRTNTPLHALTTLNDTTFVEAARAMAQRVMQQAGASPADRVRLAYRLVLARPPSTDEQAVFLAALDRLKAQYAADPAAAAKLLAVGESKRDEKLDPVEHAAFTGVCLGILNLDEALTKE